jgi:hypothetical protein
MGQHSAQSMNDGYPLYAFAFRSGLGRPRRDFTKADLATGNTDFVWVHLDLTPSEGMLKAGGLWCFGNDCKLRGGARRITKNAGPQGGAALLSVVAGPATTFTERPSSCGLRGSLISPIRLFKPKPVPWVRSP